MWKEFNLFLKMKTSLKYYKILLQNIFWKDPSYVEDLAM